MKCVKIDEKQLSKIYRMIESMLNLKVTSEIPKRKSMKIVVQKSTCKKVCWQKFELQITLPYE